MAGDVARELHADPVSGAMSVIPDLSGKPLPRIPRTMPPAASPCPLCQMAESFEAREGRARAFDGQVWREVHAASEGWLMVQNRWPVFRASGGVADLVVLRRHAEAVEQLSPAELEDLLLMLDGAPTTSARTASFLSVGVQAGSSQPHLHAQRVGTTELPPSEPDLAAWRADEDDARRRGLVLHGAQQGGSSVWVAPRPSQSGEVRVSSPTAHAAARSLLRVLSALVDVGGWAYTLAFHSASPWHVRVLPAVSAATAFDRLLGVHAVTVAPERLHSELSVKLPGS